MGHAEGEGGAAPTTAPFLAERGVAALGSDGNNDTAPSTTEGVGFPIHVLAINAMGVHLLDYLQFEDLVAALRGRRALGVPVRGRAAADRRRHRIAPQPDREISKPSSFRQRLILIFDLCVVGVSG